MIFQYDGATHADHVAGLWDKAFQSSHKDYYDYVVLPDLGGPWWEAQKSDGSIDKLVKLMVHAMDVVKPGGCGIFDKILMKDRMEKFIAENGESILYDKKKFTFKQHILESGRLVVVLWKPDEKSYTETLHDTILQNRKGLVFRQEFNELLLEFESVCNTRLLEPINDTTQRKTRPIKERYYRLHGEIASHMRERKNAMWTDTYFQTEVQLLSNWSSLITRQYIELAEAGVDTEDALERAVNFQAKIIAVVSRGTSVDQLTEAVCNVMRIG